MKFKISILIFLFIALFLSFKCAKSNDINKKDNLEIVKVKVENEKTFHGIVKSQFYSKLSFQTEGKIVFLPYVKGDFVKKNTIIAKVDGILYKIKRQQAQNLKQQYSTLYDKSKNYFNRMGLLHSSGAISDNDYEEAMFEMKANKDKLNAQNEEVKYFDEQIRNNSIKAPFDGFISQKYATIGEFAHIGEPIIEIAGTNKTQIEVMVTSSLINKINSDKEVKVKIQDKDYKGKIYHISRSSLEDGGYIVKIYLNSIFDEIKDGMTADVTMSFKGGDVIKIPIKSMLELNGEKFTYKAIKIKDNIYEAKLTPIKTLNIKNDEIEVIKGLNEGDYIFLGDTSKIKNGEKIKL